MSIRENNIAIINQHKYGLEEEKNGLHLYDNEFYYVNKFDNHDELAAWIEKNLSEE